MVSLPLLLLFDAAQFYKIWSVDSLVAVYDGYIEVIVENNCLDVILLLQTITDFIFVTPVTFLTRLSYFH